VSAASCVRRSRTPGIQLAPCLQGVAPAAKCKCRSRSGGIVSLGQRASPATKAKQIKQVAICAHWYQLNYIKTPRFPPTPCLPAAPRARVTLHSRTRSNTRLSSVVFHFTATCPIARPTSSQVTSTSFSCHAHPHHCAPFAIPVISLSSSSRRRVPAEPDTTVSNSNPS
jgi:hypothetical protein